MEELIAIVYFKLGYLSSRKDKNDTSPRSCLLFTDGSSSKNPIRFHRSYLSERARYSRSLECPPAPNYNQVHNSPRNKIATKVCGDFFQLNLIAAFIIYFICAR